MCRDVDHGNRRCKSDTSEARRLRRKAAAGLAEHTPLVSIKGETVAPAGNLNTFEEIKTEAAEISKLLAIPVDPDPEVQARIDSENEARVTRLGLAMGEEAERRVGFSRDAILEAASSEGEALVEARKEVQDASDNYKKLSREYSGFCKTEEYQAKEDFAVAEELVLREGLMAAHQRNQQAKKDLPGIEEADREARQQIPIDAAEKLAETYRGMVAEIRPVGGEIKAHKFTDPEAQKLLSETAGSHYPSEWIAAAGEVAMKVTPEGRASYNARYLHDDEGVVGAPKIHQEYLAVEDYERYRKAFGDDPSFYDSTPVIDDPEAGKKKLISFTARIPLDPSKDALDSAGNPVGEGWSKGYVIDKDNKISADHVWYRQDVEAGKTRVPTVTVATKRSDQNNRASAYHEFAHRLEEKVGGGVIMRLEEAFDKRRTTNAAGIREPLVRLFPKEKGNTELARRDSYMMSYIGKQYQTGHQREIFTMGVEAVFSGRYGAFTGIPDEKGNIYKADKDHRAFMLGTLATA
jgi:hypothetical protein